MLRALCRSYRSSLSTGFKSWEHNLGRSSVELVRSCSSTGKDEENQGDGQPKDDHITSSSATADVSTPTSQTDEAAQSQEYLDADSSAPGAEDGYESAAEPMPTVDDLEWDDVINLWANAHACYIDKDRSLLADAKRKSARDSTLKLYSPDGSIESAYDDTSQPLYDSRVWLHMYEGPGGKLLPSFCKRTGAAQYMYDFTGFKEWRVEQNALLSDEAKCLMYKLWAPGRGAGAWTDEMLAHAFKIRVQRALAIVKIKEQEFQAAETNVENLNKLQKLLGMDPHPSLKELHKPDCLHTTKHLTAWFDEWIQLYELLPHIIHPDSVTAQSDSSDTDSAESDTPDSASAEGDEAAAGSPESLEAGDGAGVDEGEGGDSGAGKRGKQKGSKRKGADGDQRVLLTKEEVKEVVSLHNELTKAANAEAKHIACHEDLWRTTYHHGTGEKFIPFLQTMPSFEERPAEEAVDTVGEYDLAIEEHTSEQDQIEIEEFRRNLSWAQQETGKSIQRAPRKRGAKGATLPPKPEAGWQILVTPLHAGGERGKPFVAMPDTTRRELTEDEELYLGHFKVEPRIFSRPRRHAPYTNDTLHMFTQRKPNPRHDIYNPPYRGSPKPKPPRSGPDKRQQRRARMHAAQKRKDLAPLLAGTQQ